MKQLSMAREINTILDLLDQVDSNGRVAINFSNERLDWFDKMNEVNKLTRFKTPTETANFILNNVIGEWGVFRLPIEVKKTILSKIDLETNKDELNFTVSFDLFKYLKIEKTNPKSQVKEIKDFFKLAAKLMTEIKTKNKSFVFSGTIGVLNNRVKGKTTYEILLKSWDNKKFPELNQQLVDQIETSPTLTGLFTQTALTLNKVGPYAWTTLKLKDLDDTTHL